MSASSMTAFVRSLFKQTGDYRSLTQRVIRDRYMQHANLDSLDDDQRSLLREIVQIMVAEMIQNEESHVSNEDAHPSKAEDKSGQNSKQEKQTKALADRRQGETDTVEEEEEKEEEGNRPKKKRKLESSEDSESDSERTFSAKKNKSKNKFANTSSESDGDSSTKAEGIVTVTKKQQRMESKRVSQKEDSDMSATEPEDTNSESEKVTSSKSKAVSKQSKKMPTEPKTVARKRKLSELSSENDKPKVMKKTISKKKISYDSSDSQLSSDEEKNLESDGAESAKPQKQTKKKQAKAKTASVKRKLSHSNKVESVSDKETKSDGHKKVLDSDDSDDGESLQQHSSKWSVASRANEGGDASTQDDLGTAGRKETEMPKNSIKPVGRGTGINSSSDDEEALANLKKKFQKSTSDSDEESSSKAETLKKAKQAHDKDQQKSKKSTKKKPSKTATQGDDKDENVKNLEKIARSCGVLPVGKRYKLAFENCRDNKERSAKLKQMLRDAGMTGKISMKSAETLKLKREAAELLSNTVILSGGRGRSRASNPLANSDKRRDREESLSPPPTAKESFSRLKGIVDSEEDSD